MSDHMREQAAVAILAATSSLTTTAANVFRGRVAPFQRTELPGGNVSTLGERIEPRTFPRPRTQERRLQVDWVAHVRKVDGAETQLNQIFKEVETALADPAVVASFGAKAITLLHIEAPIEVQNETPYLAASMNFEVWYITSENAPDTPR